jgi:hypothetical protein
MFSCYISGKAQAVSFARMWTKAADNADGEHEWTIAFELSAELLFRYA